MILRATLFVLICIALQYPLISQWNYHPIDIPMRDGKALAADVYTTDMNTPKPVILIQTPYNKAPYRLGINIPQAAGGAGFPLDTLNYNYVILDWRGRFASTAAGPQGNIGEDGYDAVEWIATQSWSDGKVGTWGPSALGQVQFMTAKEKPPHLVCCIPMVKDYKTKYHDYFYGGVLRKEHVEALQTLQFLTQDVILSHPSYDNTWKIVELTTDIAADVGVPMFIIGGWYDHFPDGVLRAFHDIKEKSDESVRDQHKLLFGPWIHGACIGEEQGILTYNNAATIAVDEALRFFDYYLLGAKNGWPLEAPVRFYQLGENEWRSTNDWYSLSEQEQYLYLNNDGRLTNTPNPSVSAESFTYDPKDPSPSIGASRFTPFVQGTPIGPQDQEPVESRNDNVIFSTEVLENDLEVSGPVTVELFLSSDRTDTDVAVRLCDVRPDGTSIIMTDGIKRMRFRNSLTNSELMTPGTVYPVSVELQNLGITFKKGHRIRIIITSSDYPRFDLNTNTGGQMYVEGGDTLVAKNNVHFGGEYPSRVIFPVPRSTAVNETAPCAIEMDIQVYPHPAISTASLAISSPATQHIDISLTDMLGRTITLYSGAWSEGQFLQLPKGLRPGMYVLVARKADQYVSKHIIIGK